MNRIQDDSHTSDTAWIETAKERLQSSGRRSGGARAEVIAQLSLESCAVSAEEIESELNKRGRKVARASVYRALEALAEIDLVQRVDLGESGSRWERVGVSDDHHHHHLVCRQCGAIVPFESELLESALHSIGSEDGFSVDSHDVTLFGRCTSCTSGTGN